MAVVKASLRSLWYKEVQGGTTFTIFDTDKHGMGDVTLNQIASTQPVYGRQADGTFKVQISITNPPGDLNSFEITFLEDTEVEGRLLQMMRDQRPLYLQRLTYNCPPVDTRALWKSLMHYTLRPDAGTRGAGPNRDGSDAGVESRVTVKVTEEVELFRTTVDRLTTAETDLIASVHGLGLENDCLSGWPGADKIIFFGAGQTAAPANVLYSVNGGGSIASIVTDPTPFTTNSDITHIQLGLISETQFRAIVGRGTDAGTKTEWAYQDFDFAGSTITAASWNLITIAATANADVMEGLLWIQRIGRLYVATAGDIYVSTDNGETDPGAAKFTGSNALAQFGIDEDDNVWAVGATNTILRETVNNRDTFSARTGPTGGGAFTAIAFAEDGTLFAGNGTSIFKNTDKAGSTAAWSSLKDFGASHKVIGIKVKNGVSQTLEVTVDDTTPGTGTVFETEDGGSTWRNLTESTNGGYNQVYDFKSDANKSIIVGDANGGTGIIEFVN